MGAVAILVSLEAEVGYRVLRNVVLVFKVRD